MSRLLEIAIKNSVQMAKEDQTFSPESLFQRNAPDSVIVADIEEVPLSAEDPSWDTVYDHTRTYLRKVFYFDMTKHLIYFLNETIKKSEELHHHPKMIVDHNEIIVESFTHDVNEVTELDLELTAYIDEIYEDIVFISRF